MALHQIFCNNPAIADEQDSPFKLLLDPVDRSHIKALRLQLGEHLALVDANADYFEVEIERIQDGEIWVRIADHLDKPQETIPLMLVQGLAKGEKMDTVLRQATELGITGFFPATMQRSVVRLDQKKAEKRVERACAIARSASLQSGRTSIPEVHITRPLHDIVNRWESDDAVLLFWEEAPTTRSISRLFDELKADQRLSEFSRFWILIGPEGGIAAEEVAMVETSPAQVFTLSLGPTILRTETAGVVASALALNELRFCAEESI